MSGLVAMMAKPPNKRIWTSRIISLIPVKRVTSTSIRDAIVVTMVPLTVVQTVTVTTLVSQPRLRISRFKSSSFKGNRSLFCSCQCCWVRGARRRTTGLRGNIIVKGSWKPRVELILFLLLVVLLWSLLFLLSIFIIVSHKIDVHFGVLHLTKLMLNCRWNK